MRLLVVEPFYGRILAHQSLVLVEQFDRGIYSVLGIAICGNQCAYFGWCGIVGYQCCHSSLLSQMSAYFIHDDRSRLLDCSSSPSPQGNALTLRTHVTQSRDPEYANQCWYVLLLTHAGRSLLPLDRTLPAPTSLQGHRRTGQRYMHSTAGCRSI